MQPYHYGNLRGELLKRAEDVLREAGVAELSLRELARAIGVSHSAPRRHFRDKQALLDALALEGFERLASIFEQDTSRGSFVDRFTAFARAYLRFASENPALLELMFARKHGHATESQLYRAVETAFAGPADLLREGQRSGDVVTGDPAQIGTSVLACLQGMVTLTSSGLLPTEEIEGLVDRTIQLVARGIRPRA